MTCSRPGPAGAAARPAVHEQTLAFYELLDALRAAHPTVAWESCASGGGRIDFGVLEKVQRFWASDMTDALSRQQIQRWTTQLVAPELVGAHVSSPSRTRPGGTLDLDFRAATALFGSFGIEWDLGRGRRRRTSTGWPAGSSATGGFRPLLHSGRTVRPESAGPGGAPARSGVGRADEALVAHVQLDESAHSRGVTVRVPGLDPEAAYDLAWEGPVDPAAVSRSAALPEAGPLAGSTATGASLATRGFRRPPAPARDGHAGPRAAVLEPRYGAVLALHVDAAHDRDATDPDGGRVGGELGVDQARGAGVAAHDPGALHPHVDVRRHDHLRAAHHRVDRDDALLRREPGLAQVELGAAPERDDRHLRRHHPDPAAVEAAHDREVGLLVRAGHHERGGGRRVDRDAGAGATGRSRVIGTRSA